MVIVCSTLFIKEKIIIIYVLSFWRTRLKNSLACYWFSATQINFITIFTNKIKFRCEEIFLFIHVRLIWYVCMHRDIHVIATYYISSGHSYSIMTFHFSINSINSLWYVKQHNYPVQESTSAKLYIPDISVDLFRYLVIPLQNEKA